MSDTKYASEIAGFKVCRNVEPEPLSDIVKVDLPAIPSPVDVLDNGKYPPLTLRLYFASVKNAAEAMENSGFQIITVYAAEQYWIAAEAKCGIRALRFKLEARPRALIPDSVAAVGGGAVCEYDVTHYAAYCDGEKLWEVCPEKQLCVIGGRQYPFPEKTAE